ncbi:hypothetical protein LEMLEM_LOCUS472, partial [Lemmus lemmus]
TLKHPVTVAFTWELKLVLYLGTSPTICDSILEKFSKSSLSPPPRTFSSFHEARGMSHLLQVPSKVTS